MNHSVSLLSLSVVIALISTSASATTGYFMHGYGVKAQGNAGTSIAQFQDALTIASNPAGLSWIGSRVDAGLTVFTPDRSAKISGNQYGANGSYDGNGRKYFVIPDIALNHEINDQVALGLAVYGNGGMNTGYDKNPYAAFGNTGSAGVDLTQVFVSPAVSWKYTDHQSIGIATNILYQRFEARGIGGFAGYSADGANLSNRGKDSSTGIGARIGWAGHFFDERLTLGANYSSKIDADRFDKYRGLFAEQGDFDVPESYGVGAAFKVTPKLTLAADVQRINYSDVDSVGNTFDVAKLQQGHAFGTARGPGFGWDDINVYKVGASYQATPQLTLRAGYSHNDQPVQDSETFLNILAPGVIQDHVSIGATYNIDSHQEISVAYTHALEDEVEGVISPAFGGGKTTLKMNQNILGFSYGYKF
ncbi:OmpP1/FadL family transporter [Acinetobacter sp. WCHAc010052]|uniref:OmpP1/FadL family transporter n=1 Tax=Acinetobacter sp. WCHAc010052 TaxID=2004647 RepID=UPI000B3CD4CB|nr:outer membrane protein transport protein [Acinetobacter sp. WCHAc010052]AXY58855.1 long-chain fatty acid transporter [Acinetobacter sp. WCHAc010052]